MIQSLNNIMTLAACPSKASYRFNRRLLQAFGAVFLLQTLVGCATQAEKTAQDRSNNSIPTHVVKVSNTTFSNASNLKNRPATLSQLALIQIQQPQERTEKNIIEPVAIVKPANKIAKPLTQPSKIKQKPIKPAKSSQHQITDLSLKTNYSIAKELSQVKHSKNTPVIWDKIRTGFQLKQSSHPRVKKELNWLIKNKEYLHRALASSTPYLHYILTEIRKRNLPTELALLPIIESGFQPFASSPTKAMGLWQFMSATATEYGLKQNWWYDGRRDIVSSTNAALNYLEILTAKYEGDWLLGLSAYNAGAATVFRSMRKNRNKNKPSDYWSLALPKETRKYVPRLLAITQIIAQPKKYGFNLKAIPDDPFFTIVDINTQMDLGVAAQLAEINIEHLHGLNPGFKRWATDPDGPYRLCIPIEKVEHFQHQLAKLKPNQRLRWKRYKIQAGDNLGYIAQKHTSSVTAIKKINKLKSDRIVIGRHLLIPLSQSPREYISQNKVKRSKTHVVRTGESLWHIAKRYNVAYHQLAKWNQLKLSSILKPGQTLKVHKL